MKLRVGGAIAAALVVAVAITGGTAAAKASKCGTVTLNEQAWAGSTANTYVVKNVLEKSLGCKVNISKVAEVPGRGSPRKRGTSIPWTLELLAQSSDRSRKKATTVKTMLAGPARTIRSRVPRTRTRSILSLNTRAPNIVCRCY